MTTLLLTIFLLVLAISGFAIRMFLIPGSTFKKSCTSSFDPDGKGSTSCSCASGKPEECGNRDT